MKIASKTSWYLSLGGGRFQKSSLSSLKKKKTVIHLIWSQDQDLWILANFSKKIFSAPSAHSVHCQQILGEGAWWQKPLSITQKPFRKTIPWGEGEVRHIFMSLTLKLGGWWQDKHNSVKTSLLDKHTNFSIVVKDKKLYPLPRKTVKQLKITAWLLFKETPKHKNTPF